MYLRTKISFWLSNYTTFGTNINSHSLNECYNTNSIIALIKVNNLYQPKFKFNQPKFQFHKPKSRFQNIEIENQPQIPRTLCKIQKNKYPTKLSQKGFCHCYAQHQCFKRISWDSPRDSSWALSKHPGSRVGYDSST